MGGSETNDVRLKLTPLAVDPSQLDPSPVVQGYSEGEMPLVVSYKEYMAVVKDLFIELYGGYDSADATHVALRARLKAALSDVADEALLIDRGALEEADDCPVLVERRSATELRKAGRVAESSTPQRA